MPKKQTNEMAQEKTAFSREEWLMKVKEKLMQQPWSSAVMKSTDALILELVRVGDSENLMVRIRTANIKNTLKLARKEHIESLIELAEAIATNYNNIRDKLEAIMEILPKSRRIAEEEV